MRPTVSSATLLSHTSRTGLAVKSVTAAAALRTPRRAASYSRAQRPSFARRPARPSAVNGGDKNAARQPPRVRSWHGGGAGRGGTAGSGGGGDRDVVGMTIPERRLQGRRVSYEAMDGLLAETAAGILGSEDDMVDVTDVDAGAGAALGTAASPAASVPAPRNPVLGAGFNPEAIRFRGTAADVRRLAREARLAEQRRLEAERADAREKSGMGDGDGDADNSPPPPQRMQSRVDSTLRFRPSHGSFLYMRESAPKDEAAPQDTGEKAAGEKVRLDVAGDAAVEMDAKEVRRLLAGTAASGGGGRLAAADAAAQSADAGRPAAEGAEEGRGGGLLTHPCLLQGACRARRGEGCAYAGLPATTCLHFARDGSCDAALRGCCPFSHREAGGRRRVEEAARDVLFAHALDDSAARAEAAAAARAAPTVAALLLEFVDAAAALLERSVSGGSDGGAARRAVAEGTTPSELFSALCEAVRRDSSSGGECMLRVVAVPDGSGGQAPCLAVDLAFALLPRDGVPSPDADGAAADIHRAGAGAGGAAHAPTPADAAPDDEETMSAAEFLERMWREEEARERQSQAAEAGSADSAASLPELGQQPAPSSPQFLSRWASFMIPVVPREDHIVGLRRPTPADTPVTLYSVDADEVDPNALLMLSPTLSGWLAGRLARRFQATELSEEESPEGLLRSAARHLLSLRVSACEGTAADALRQPWAGLSLLQDAMLAALLPPSSSSSAAAAAGGPSSLLSEILCGGGDGEARGAAPGGRRETERYVSSFTHTHRLLLAMHGALCDGGAGSGGDGGGGDSGEGPAGWRAPLLAQAAVVSLAAHCSGGLAAAHEGPWLRESGWAPWTDAQMFGGDGDGSPVPVNATVYNAHTYAAAHAPLVAANSFNSLLNYFLLQSLRAAEAHCALCERSPVTEVLTAGGGGEDSEDSARAAAQAIRCQRRRRRRAMAAELPPRLRVPLGYVAALRRHALSVREGWAARREEYYQRRAAHEAEREAAATAASPHTRKYHRGSSGAERRQEARAAWEEEERAHTPAAARLLAPGTATVGAEATARLLRLLTEAGGNVYRAMRTAVSVVHAARMIRHAAREPPPQTVAATKLVHRRVWSRRLRRKVLVQQRVPVLKVVSGAEQQQQQQQQQHRERGGADGGEQRPGRRAHAPPTPVTLLHALSPAVVEEVVRLGLRTGSAGARLASGAHADCVQGGLLDWSASRGLWCPNGPLAAAATPRGIGARAVAADMEAAARRPLQLLAAAGAGAEGGEADLWGHRVVPTALLCELELAYGGAEGEGEGLAREARRLLARDPRTFASPAALTALQRLTVRGARRSVHAVQAGHALWLRAAAALETAAPAPDGRQEGVEWLREIAAEARAQAEEAEAVLAGPAGGGGGRLASHALSGGAAAAAKDAASVKELLARVAGADSAKGDDGDLAPFGQGGGGADGEESAEGRRRRRGRKGQSAHAAAPATYEHFLSAVLAQSHPQPGPGQWERLWAVAAGTLLGLRGPDALEGGGRPAAWAALALRDACVAAMLSPPRVSAELVRRSFMAVALSPAAHGRRRAHSSSAASSASAVANATTAEDADGFPAGDALVEGVPALFRAQLRLYDAVAARGGVPATVAGGRDFPSLRAALAECETTEDDPMSAWPLFAPLQPFSADGTAAAPPAVAAHWLRLTLLEPFSAATTTSASAGAGTVTTAATALPVWLTARTHPADAATARVLLAWLTDVGASDASRAGSMKACVALLRDRLQRAAARERVSPR